MKKIIFFVLVLLGLLGGYLYQSNLSETRVLFENETKAVVETTATPFFVPAEPVTISIPSLDVKTNVEHVAEDNEGRMDVPEIVSNTAWYELGAMPGEKGNSVIAGHRDTPDGKPSVFYEIDSLNTGDEIITTDENGVEYIFEVADVRTYQDSSFPIETVFGNHEDPRLNLITCAGKFDQQSQNYSERTVVFSTLTEIGSSQVN